MPGVSVGIVKDGKVLMAKGYGVKRMGEKNPVDENTLFLIASNTKAFTGTSLAILVEEGKIKWDDKVIKHLPWFKMSDDYVTNHLTVRDLLVHHSGLPPQAGDMMMFPPSTMSRRGIVEKLDKIPLIYDFRTTYAYDNILYLAAGELIQAVSGLTWEDFVKTRIFDKVGMTGSISRYSLLKTKKNVAYGHSRYNNEVRIVESFMDRNTGDAANPAGGICSNAADMTQWLITQLDSGRTPLKQKIFEPATTPELWKIIRPMPIKKVPDAIKPTQQNFWGYASGFRSYDYQRHKIIYHGGSLRGFVSQISMVPDLNLGIVVLTNQQSSGAYWSIINHVLDYYMQNPSFDWITGYKAVQDSAIARSIISQKKTEIVKKNNEQLVYPVEMFLGNYEEDQMGGATITKEENGLVLRFDNSKHYIADLEYFQYNNFLAKFRNTEFATNAYLTFEMNPNGTVELAKLKVLNSDIEVDFDEMVLKKVSTPKTPDALKMAILKQFKNQPEGEFAVAFKNLSNGEEFLMNAKTMFHTASTMKTPVMIEAFKQAGEGKFKLTDSVLIRNEFKSIIDGSLYSLSTSDDSELDLYGKVGTKQTIYDVIYPMIILSSNLGTNIMVDMLGADKITATMRSLGAKDIQVRRGVEDQKAFKLGLSNETTAYDLMLIMEAIATGKAVNKEASEAMLKILLDQQFKTRIGGKLPKDVKVASKSGSFPTVSHDSGIVILPDGRKYVIVLLSRGVESEEDIKNTQANISRLIYDYIN